MELKYKHAGHYWSSHEEAQRARMLQEQEKAGAISNLVFHPRLRLSDAEIKYTADFSYVIGGDSLTLGTKVFEDFNSGRDPRFKDIARLWAAYGPAPLYITRAKHGKEGLVFSHYKTIEGGENK